MGFKMYGTKRLAGQEMGSHTQSPPGLRAEEWGEAGGMRWAVCRDK